MRKVLRIDKDGFFIEDVILQDNESIPSDCVEIQCQAGFYKPKWDGNKWIEGGGRSIEEVRTVKLSELNETCQNLILTGFNSTAYQSTDKLYGSTIEDQSNITGNAIAAVSKINNTPGCENDKFYYHAQGEDFTEWTPEEILQLARDFRTFKEEILFKNKQLQAYVNSLTISEDVEKVTWDTQLPSQTNTTA